MGAPDFSGSKEIEETVEEAQAAAAPRRRNSPLAFGAGYFGVSIFTETFGGYAYFYYVDFLGLALPLAAVVRSLFTVWDSINDPFVGYISDHSHSRLGRRHAWIYSALPLLMLVFYMVFSVPARYNQSSRLVGYMLAVFLLYETLITCIGINYSALFPAVFRSLPERTHAAGFVQGGLLLGLLAGLALAPLIYQRYGFSAMAGVYAAAGGILLFASLPFNPETNHTQASAWQELWPSVRLILFDRLFWLYVLMMVLVFFAISLLPFALPFYVKYVLRAPPSTITFLSGLSMLASLAAVPLWSRLVRRLGLHKGFFISIAGTACSLFIISIASIPQWAAVATVIYGLAVPGIQISNIVIRAELVSRSITRTGAHNEGFYYGMMNFSLRMGGLLQALAMFLTAQFFGYTSGEAPGPHPDLAFRFLMGALPAASLLLAAVSARGFFKHFSNRANPPVIQ